MSWRYDYTPYVWLMLGAGAFLAGLAVYAWRHRSVPGALPFTLAMAAACPWAVGAALELAAVDVPDKIFWIKFEALWPVPAVTAGLWFALEYANLSRWLTRPALAVLWSLPLLVLLLAVTNDAHHLVWLRFPFDGHVHPVLGRASGIIIGYGYLLALANSSVFIWLFMHSPLHRWPAAVCLIGHVVVPLAYMLEVKSDPAPPMSLTVAASAFAAAMYALAMFRFHMFDLIPIARGTMIEQMREGMLVLDVRQRIVDLNPAAERTLGVVAARLRGKFLADVFPAIGKAESEITLDTGGAGRHYVPYQSALKDRRGFPLGSLILLHDVTDQKQAQARLLEQQRAVATLQERDRVARELHDTIGQVLGYVKMQAQSARGLLAQNQIPEADRYLTRLVAVAHDAHTDVREYILGARVGLSADGAFLPALEQYLRRFSENYGIATRLRSPFKLPEQAIEPRAAAELLRIIQESLTNVRKHAQARGVDICLGVSDGSAEIVVQDDGTGCDPAMLETAEGQGFGLRFMRERAEEVGGSVRVYSAPGEGTKVTIRVPLRKRNL